MWAEEEEDAVNSENPHNKFFSLWILWHNKLNDKLIMIEWKKKYINIKDKTTTNKQNK